VSVSRFINTNPYTDGSVSFLFFANALQYAHKLTANLPASYTSHQLGKSYRPGEPLKRGGSEQ
jgi:hypothetical protein